MRLTRDEIENGRSKRGGWTRATLASWGVPWPPPKGWRRALENGQPIPRKRDASFWKTEEGQNLLKSRRAEADWSRLDMWD